MRIYVDEDMASAMLVALLQKAGHDVETPLAAACWPVLYPVQLTFSIHEKRSFLTSNYQDFEGTALAPERSRGCHLGILVVRRDNDPTQRS